MLFNSCSGLTSIDIPNSVKNIGDGAFVGCSKLTTMTIPNSLTRIEDGLFKACSGIKNITIPGSVESIDNYAFQGCTGLTNIDIPNSVNYIGEGAFQDCSSLVSIEIPNSVNNIGMRAFKGCRSLTGLALPNYIKSIETGTFQDCSGLTNIGIPNSVNNIGDEAFQGCSGFANIEIPNSVKNIGIRAFKGCTSLARVVLPNSMKSIETGTFQDCSVLTNIDIPESVTSIGDAAFSNNDRLSYVEIPHFVNTIGEGAFNSCDALKKVSIGYSIRKIGDGAFADCSELDNITIFAPEIPDCFDNLRNVSRDNCTLLVPSAVADYYKNAKPWNGFMHIEDAPDATYNINLMQASDGKGYGTAYLPFDVKRKAGDTAKYYYASLPKDGMVNMREARGKSVPARNGFVIIDESGAKATSVAIDYEPTEDAKPENALVGCLNDSTVADASSEVYVLGLSKGVAGFYRPNSDVMKARRAFLPVAGDYKTLKFTFDGVTGIDSAEKESDDSDAPVYDLSGRRVYGTLPQGIYIKGNKKFYVK